MTLKDARYRRRITQRDLCILTGFSPPKLSLIENGYIIPSEGDRKILAEALKFNVDEIEYTRKKVTVIGDGRK